MNDRLGVCKTGERAWWSQRILGQRYTQVLLKLSHKQLHVMRCLQKLVTDVHWDKMNVKGGTCITGVWKPMEILPHVSERGISVCG